MPARPALGPARRALLLLAAILLVLVASTGSWGPVAPAAADHDPAGGGPPVPEPGRPWFGPQLDVESIEPLAEYVERVGASPSSFTLPVDYPVSAADREYLDRQFRGVAALGAVVVLDLQPGVPLRETSTEHATELAELLQIAHEDLGLWFLVRFAPEMNGSWELWGQQPAAYKAAFRRWAAVLHAQAPATRTVWSPVYGSGYPYLDEQGTEGDLDLTGTSRPSQLDTDGDGELSNADDPYGPYYPGDDAVDWVGLTLYRLGQDQGLRRNTAPDRGELRARLAERFGYGNGGGRGASFYDRFAEGRGKPMVLQTGALWNPAVGGASELAVKRGWWRQVFGAAAGHPLIGVVSWLEVSRVEPEVDSSPVDWRVTSEPRVLAAFRTALQRSVVDLGPVSTPVAPEDLPPPPGAEDGRERVGPGADGRRAAGSDVPPLPVPTGSAAGTAYTAGVAVLLLLLAGLAGRLRPAWRHPPTPTEGRDERWDAVRGALVVLGVAGSSVVLVHGRDLAGVLLGAVPLTAGFLLLAGYLRGRRHAALVRRVGESGALGVRWRRAATVYLVAVVASLATWFAGRVPGVTLGSLARADHDGRTRDLFPEADRLLDYPTPWAAARPVLLLVSGPWVTAVLGLLVVAFLLAPLVLALLHRGLWWVVLPLSWAAYVAGARWESELLPAQFADSFPPLAWQVVLVHGLAAGVHRDGLRRHFRRPVVRALAALVLTAYVAVVGLWAAGRVDLARWHTGVDLPPGRLAALALLAAAATAFVTSCWRPAAPLLRPLVPVGQAPLPALAVHLVLLLVLVNVLDRAPALEDHPHLVLAVAVAVQLALLLGAARRLGRRGTSYASQPSGRSFLGSRLTTSR